MKADFVFVGLNLNTYVQEKTLNIGQCRTILNLLIFPNDFQKSRGLNQWWYKDSHATAHLQNNAGFEVRQYYIIQKPDPKGTFSFRVPLKHIYGFCDDYDEVVCGFKQQPTLVRKSDKDLIFRNNAADADGDGCFGKTFLVRASCASCSWTKTCVV